MHTHTHIHTRTVSPPHSLTDTLLADFFVLILAILSQAPTVGCDNGILFEGGGPEGMAIQGACSRSLALKED